MPKKRRILWVIFILLGLAVTLSLPPVWSRAVYHAHEAYRTVKYWIKPPSEAIFIPSTFNEDPQAPSSAAQNSPDSPMVPLSTATAATPTRSTLQATATPVAAVASPTHPIPAETQAPTSTPTPTLAPLPSYVLLQGFRCEPQFMNNCGPATLSMYLSYYDWGKNQKAAAAVLKPNAKDVNVMPSEVADFVNQHTEQRALWRYGGDLLTLKTLVNAGFPVMIEKSFEPYDLRNEGWMGHYNLVVGYDDEKKSLTVHDSYLMIHTPWGLDIPPNMWDTFIGFDFSYQELEQAWRSFNYVFIVVYPPEKETEVLDLIGPLDSEAQACQIAYDRAMQETTSLPSLRDQFFAWFNAGTSLVCLEDFASAANAFDTAFGLYPEIDKISRPYRILWYQPGPYVAYYYTERYSDVIDLASQTLGHMAEPVLEESYYWQALSYAALGDTQRAVSDLRKSLDCHPGYAPSIAKLKELGKYP